ncbi:MAG: hypothetical protein HQ564_02110 [Candidatus Saganbacteria bacterium]|nr:hypothetical protein [Candidatus Saganbacteria bacterium]
MKVSKREQWLLLGALCIAAAYILQQYVFTAQFKAIGVLKDEIKTVELSLLTARAKEKQLKSVQAKAPEKIRRKTKEELALDVISYLADNIAYLDLNLVSLKPHYSTTTVKQASLMKFDLIVEGSYNQVYKFMSAIEQSPNLLVVDSFKLGRKKNNTITSSVAISAYY